MRVRLGLAFAIIIILAVVTSIVVWFAPERAESSFPPKYDLGKERSSEPQFYQMDIEIITRASNGSVASVETYSMQLRGQQGDLAAGVGDRWTCAWLALKLGDSPEVTVPEMEGWTYDFNRRVGIDEHGQVLGISHAKFESLTDSKGKNLAPLVGYQIYNQFVQFHAFVDKFATADLDGGKGIQDLKNIGDSIVFDEFSEDLPLAVGLIIKEGSIYKAGKETLEFKGVSVVADKPCALLGVDGGEGSYTMAIEVGPKVISNTVGGTRYFGDIHVDLESMWLKKAAITVIDVTETSIENQVVANTTIESRYRIWSITEEEYRERKSQHTKRTEKQ